MRLLTDAELSNVSAGTCPFCVSATIFLIAGTSTTALGYFSRQFYLYLSGAILLTLSAGICVKLFKNNQDHHEGGSNEHSNCF